jgi:tetratricopeptide (TPR) repeat protein
MQLRNAARPPAQSSADIDLDQPETVLLEHLKSINANQRPEAALAIHAAIGKMLRASGASPSRAVDHFTQARDLALRGKDGDAKLAAYLDLAEALLEDGRPWDASNQLIDAHLVSPDHFVENRVKLNLLHGRSKFQLGESESALKWLHGAEQDAVQKDEKVSVALDIGIVHTCLGDAGASLKVLEKALMILKAARKAGADAGMSADVHDALALQVYFRLGEAHHFRRDYTAAKAHFEKALSFDRKSSGRAPKQVSAMKADLVNIAHGIGPELQCPRIPKNPLDKTLTEVEKVEAEDANAKASLLLSRKEYEKAEELLVKDVKRHVRPYKNIGVVRSLNQLAKLYMIEGRENFLQVAKRFRQALTAALSCCGVDTVEVKEAYEGLKSIQDKVSSQERAIVTATINRYNDAANNGDQPSLPSPETEVA